MGKAYYFFFAVDGSWSAWTSWGCTSAKEGYRVRTRSCPYVTCSNGPYCPGSDKQENGKQHQCFITEGMWGDKGYMLKLIKYTRELKYHCDYGQNI